MSMLAEPRRKQKIINLRAKNNAWSNDSNKFGQRMLEKMGWSSGKGLGAKENGIVEHVVARYKNDEKGLGFEDRNDQWTKHEDDFNALLANLSNTDDNTEILHSGISLEKKSKNSKARIHYHKFTRGKDLSRYSDKDLANIFGKKSFRETEIPEPITQDVKTSEQVFVGKGNMDEYFKKKLAAFKDKSKLCNSSTDIKDNDESDYCFQGFSNSAEVESETIANESKHQPFSFYDSKKDDPTSCQNLELTPCPDLDTSKRKKKSGSRKRDGMSGDNLEENNSLVHAQEESQDNVTEVESSKDKKSKKKKPKKKDVVVGNSNVKGEENNATECIQEERQDITEVEILKVKKSKKKKRKECLEEEIQVCEEVNRKLKNRKNFQDQDAYLEEHVPKKKKKMLNIYDNKLKKVLFF